MVVPAVFAFSGGDETALNKGAGLMFVTLPRVFDTMPYGDAIGSVFFIMVFFAALTSSISLMETVVSVLQDKLGMNIHFSCLAARVEEHVRNNDRKNRERMKQCHLLSEGEWMTE